MNNPAPSTANLPSSVNMDEMKQSFHRHGYAVARGLFSGPQVQEIKEEFDQLAHQAPVPGHFEPKSNQPGCDPLDLFPRVHHPHRISEVARKSLIHPGVIACLRELMGEDIWAAQSMYYYKPPGSRGQAMHQDNFYLMVEPQTCVAAWTAIDDADPENGGMYLVADTASQEIACPGKADPRESFTTHLVPLPPGKKALPCTMKSGDTLFFNGNSIHGSGPNRSKDRFRRSFICHYVPRSTTRISKFYLPLLGPDGEDVWLEANQSGGACGSAWEKDNVIWEGGIH